MVNLPRLSRVGFYFILQIIKKPKVIFFWLVYGLHLVGIVRAIHFADGRIRVIF